MACSVTTPPPLGNNKFDPGQKDQVKIQMQSQCTSQKKKNKCEGNFPQCGKPAKGEGPVAICKVFATTFWDREFCWASVASHLVTKFWF